MYVGAVTVFAGNGKNITSDGSGLEASFNFPYGIAVNQESGEIYVTELGGHVIRKISPQGSDFVQVIVVHSV